MKGSFWVLALAIAVLSITVALYNLFPSTNTTTTTTALQKCDPDKWKSRLIDLYKMAVVLTVDLEGCGQFRSLQKAIEAVPLRSSSKNLIIFDVGTYREKLNVDQNKTNLISEGKGYLKIFLSWNDTVSSSEDHSYRACSINSIAKETTEGISGSIT